MGQRDEPESGSNDAADRALVAAALEGDVRALESLIDRHQVRVLRVLRLMGVPSQDREDVAQDVFIRVFRHLGGFRRGQAFGGWLYRITVNSAHDYRSRRGRQARGEAPWPEGIEDPSAGSAPDPDLRRTLEAALEALTPRERAVFVLREMEGLETAEVASALDITSITVRRHLALARRHLRRILEGGKKSNPR